jgi:hypothetical protein
VPRWALFLAAILAGNLVYFALFPLLPVWLKHQPFQADVGLALDFLICVGVYVAWRRLTGRR